MPLSPHKPRKPIHIRDIQCKGYEREDGLWDIEAHLVDTKAVPHARRHSGKVRQPGEPVHNMWLRLTIDLDMLIHEAEAKTDDGPHLTCGDVAVNFKRLEGVTIGRGWRREVFQRLGGIHGCTHLVELLWPLATTAFQATGRAREAHNANRPVTKPPYQLNSCHIYSDDGDAVLERWPQFYTGAKKPIENV
jgi:Protein of unknown function (DUF2889)